MDIDFSALASIDFAALNKATHSTSPLSSAGPPPPPPPPPASLASLSSYGMTLAYKLPRGCVDGGVRVGVSGSGKVSVWVAMEKGVARMSIGGGLGGDPGGEPPLPPATLNYDSLITTLIPTHSPTTSLLASGPSITHICHATNKTLRTYPGHITTVISLSLSPSSDTFASLDASGCLKLWSLSSSAPLSSGCVAPASSPPSVISWDPSGDVLGVFGLSAAPSERGGTGNIVGMMYDATKSPPTCFSDFKVTRDQLSRSMTASGVPEQARREVMSLGLRSVTAAEFSRDGASVMLKCTGGVFAVLDAYTYEVLAIPVEHLPASGPCGSGPTAACFGRGGKEAVVAVGGKVMFYKNYMSSVSKVEEVGDVVKGVAWVDGYDALVTCGGVLGIWQPIDEENE